MEDNRKRRKRPQRLVKRAYERNRLEEELWTRAYQVVWPVVRRFSKRLPPPQGREKPKTARKLARRA
jgi:hypothetical protein